MNYFKFRKVEVFRESNKMIVYFDSKLSFEYFSTSKLYVSDVDVWITLAILKGITHNGFKN